MVDKYANVLALQIIAMWMTKIRETNRRKTRRMLKTLSVYLRTPEYVRSHKNCIVYTPNLETALQCITKYSIARIYNSTYHTYEYNFTGHCFVYLTHTYQVPGTLRYVVYGTWYFTGIYLPNISRLCSSGYVQNIPGVFTPGITVQRASVSSVGHSHPYPELL